MRVEVRIDLRVMKAIRMKHQETLLRKIKLDKLISLMN